MPAKPKAISSFEKKFNCLAIQYGPVFILPLARTWEDFLHSAFVFVNDCGLTPEEIVESQDEYSLSGRGIYQNVWGTPCLLFEGRLVTPAGEIGLPGVNLITSLSAEFWSMRADADGALVN